MSEEAKSSSEILNELFSTFNSTYKKEEASKSPKKSKKDAKKKKKKKHDGDAQVDAKLKKTKKSADAGKKDKKKKKRDSVASTSSSSPVKKKKRKVVKEDSDRVEIGDGFVVLKKSKVKELEDGEIEEEKEVKLKHKKESVFEGAKGNKKLSASQAYKLDAEERLLLGYDEFGNKREKIKKPERRASSSHKSGSSSSCTRPSSSSSSSSSHYSSDSKPRLAPPRDSYRNSYMKFEKQREYEDYHSSNSRSYDTASYYDYHAQRSHESTGSSRSGFGYVGKSYYYEDVEEDRRERDSRDSSRDRDSRDSRDRDSSRDSRGGSDRDREHYDQRRYGSSSWRHRNRSRSRSPLRRSYYHPDDIIDRAHLLEIARKNAKKLLKSGVMASDIFSRDQILAIKAGGKSVDELTQYCKKLARRDAAGDARSASDSDDDNDRGHFIHHPFQVKDKPLPTITLNIRNAVPLPVRTPQELAIESAKLRTVFPVSSGTQHRFKEIEWKPVEEDKKEEDKTSKAVVPLDDKSTSSATGPNVATVAPMVKETEENEQQSSSSTSDLLAIEAPPVPKEVETGISVDGPDLPAVDIGSVIGLRLKAMRMLQENPECGEAKMQLTEATQMMKHWADAKALEPKFLTVAELSSGPQAWAKRDQLRKTRALDSGMGMHLLQKMGWRPGEGLGKNKEGQLEPLALDVKTDKKGLTAAVEELMYGKSKGSGSGGPSMPQVYDLSGKHPVSALMELTAKRRWGNPEFELCFEHGPPHKRQFVYKVIVNGVEYQPCVAVGNKKQAKANAAAFCLQSLGLLPTNCQMGPGELLQTVGDSDGTPIGGEVSEQGSSNPLKKFGAPSYLQTVPAPQVVPPLPLMDPKNLMPPPPPPPPLFPPSK